MNPRKAIKEQHERYVINKYLQWIKKTHGRILSVVDWPDPPEAIIKEGNRKSWVELTTVFSSDEWARDLNSYATPEENHVPMKGTQYEMDARFAKRFSETLGKKFTKITYKEVYGQLGKGTLLVAIYHPWYDDHTEELMRQEYEQLSLEKKNIYFDEILLFIAGFDNDNFYRWS